MTDPFDRLDVGASLLKEMYGTWHEAKVATLTGGTSCESLPQLRAWKALKSSRGGGRHSSLDDYTDLGEME